MRLSYSEKTGKPLVLPLNESIGNSLADYLLNERQVSKSEYIFLRFEAPFAPIKSHAACYRILFRIANNVGVESNGRIYGTRITRHSTASRLLRQGVPLPVISEALGHSNPDNSMRYITTDDLKLAECTLPFKGGECDVCISTKTKRICWCISLAMCMNTSYLLMNYVLFTEKHL